MNLLSTRLFSETDFYHRIGARILFRGDMSLFSQKLRDSIFATMEATKDNTGITVTLAVNYGGQDEIVRAVNKWIDTTNRSSHITKSLLRENLDLSFIPPVDYIVRSGGEKRLSNFFIMGCSLCRTCFC